MSIKKDTLVEEFLSFLKDENQEEKFSDELFRHLTIALTSAEAAKSLQDFIINKTKLNDDATAR
jgi:hypothetical protein